jgi:hypothetical protein
LKDFSTTFENEVSSFGKENLLKMLFNLYLLGMQFLKPKNVKRKIEKYIPRTKYQF